MDTLCSTVRYILHSFYLPSFTSDDSDEPTGLVSHLPRRLLREHAEKRVRRRAPLNRERTENDSDDSDEDDVAIPEDPKKWVKTNPGLVGSRVPAFVPMDMSAQDREELESLTSALGYYKLFQPDSFVKEVKITVYIYTYNLFFVSLSLQKKFTFLHLLFYLGRLPVKAVRCPEEPEAGRQRHERGELPLHGGHAAAWRVRSGPEEAYALGGQTGLPQHAGCRGHKVCQSILLSLK